MQGEVICPGEGKVGGARVRVTLILCCQYHGQRYGQCKAED